MGTAAIGLWVIYTIISRNQLLLSRGHTQSLLNFELLLSGEYGGEIGIVGEVLV